MALFVEFQKRYSKTPEKFDTYLKKTVLHEISEHFATYSQKQDLTEDFDENDPKLAEKTQKNHQNRTVSTKVANYAKEQKSAIESGEVKYKSHLLHCHLVCFHIFLYQYSPVGQH